MTKISAERIAAIATHSPSPRGGEGWGEGALTSGFPSTAEPPHPALSPPGRGLFGAVAGAAGE